MPNTVQLLRDMIAIPSVNPMRANSGESVEKGMANFIETVLNGARIDCELQRLGQGKTAACRPGGLLPAGAQRQQA